VTLELHQRNPRTPPFEDFVGLEGFVGSKIRTNETLELHRVALTPKHRTPQMNKAKRAPFLYGSERKGAFPTVDPNDETSGGPAPW